MRAVVLALALGAPVTLGACDEECPVYSSYPANGTACSVPKVCHYGGCYCDDSSGTWICPDGVGRDLSVPVTVKDMSSPNDSSPND
jgi:hypothetical protein